MTRVGGRGEEGGCGPELRGRAWWQGVMVVLGVGGVAGQRPQTTSLLTVLLDLQGQRNNLHSMLTNKRTVK